MFRIEVQIDHDGPFLGYDASFKTQNEAVDHAFGLLRRRCRDGEYLIYGFVVSRVSTGKPVFGPVERVQAKVIKPRRTRRNRYESKPQADGYLKGEY